MIPRVPFLIGSGVLRPERLTVLLLVHGKIVTSVTSHEVMRHLRSEMAKVLVSCYLKLQLLAM